MGWRHKLNHAQTKLVIRINLLLVLAFALDLLIKIICVLCLLISGLLYYILNRSPDLHVRSTVY